MKQLIKKSAGIVAAFALVAATLFTPALPVSAQISKGLDSAKGDNVPDSLFDGNNAVFTTVVNALLFVIGAVSVIMLIWGGIRYTTSAGNSASVTSAKNTIMYAIIGIIIAFLAYAIVNWVLRSIDPAASTN